LGPGVAIMASGTHQARPDWFKPVRFYARDLPYLIKKCSVAPALTKCSTIDKAIEACFPSQTCLDEMGKGTLASPEQLAAMQAFKQHIAAYVYRDEIPPKDSAATAFLNHFYERGFQVVAVDVDVSDTRGYFGTKVDFIAVKNNTSSFLCCDFFSLRTGRVFETQSALPAAPMVPIDLSSEDRSAVPAFADRAVVVNNLLSDWFQDNFMPMANEINDNWGPNFRKVSCWMLRWMQDTVEGPRVDMRKLARADVASAWVAGHAYEIQKKDALRVKAHCLWQLFKLYWRSSLLLRDRLTEVRERNRVIALTHMDGAPGVGGTDDEAVKPFSARKKLRLSTDDPAWATAVLAKHRAPFENAVKARTYRESATWRNDPAYPGPKAAKRPREEEDE
jgi:hypothetical protein